MYGEEGPWFLAVEWLVEGVDFEDGDRHLVAVVDESDQEMLYDVEQEANYREGTCGCRMAELILPGIVPGP